MRNFLRLQRPATQTVVVEPVTVVDTPTPRHATQTPIYQTAVEKTGIDPISDDELYALPIATGTLHDSRQP